MASPKRITSRELVEIRTVKTRAKTALITLNIVQDQDRYGGLRHTPHEISMMRSALITAIDVLEKVEQATGYREAE
jgi:hypothetical protein